MDRNSPFAGIAAALTGLFNSAGGPLAARHSDSTPAYPKKALADHPGANPYRGHFGSRGYTRGRYTDDRGRSHVSVVDASRWVPHIGTKQHARGAERMASKIAMSSAYGKMGRALPT